MPYCHVQYGRSPLSLSWINQTVSVDGFLDGGTLEGSVCIRRLSHIYVFLTCLLCFWGSSFYLTVCLSRTCIGERSPGDLLWCCVLGFGCVCESAVCLPLSMDCSF
jgi:hypothetical protein